MEILTSMNKELTYHFTGIKGSGMSALALILHNMGYKVQGSDQETYFFTQRGLEKAGVELLPFNADNIQEGMFIICGNAFGDDHPEVVRAKELGLDVMRYHFFLGELIKDYTSVAITGSHGKTSTTGLMAHVMRGLQPTNFLIGDGTGAGQEDAEYFVLEADEYRKHFLAYHPDYAIFTNIDFDHPDYYENIDQVFAANTTFAHQVKKKVIAYGGDAYLRQFADQSDLDVWYYGLEGGDNHIVASNVDLATDGSHFDVHVMGEFYGHFDIPTFGEHNVMNALSVIGFCYFENFPADRVAEELRTFGGVKRRFSEKKIGDMTLIDDYAHHPSEIKATINAARQKYPNKKIVSVFQPHTFSRTIALMDEFAGALDLSDDVFLCEIFASAREKDNKQVSVSDLANKVTKPVQVLPLENVSPLLDYDDTVMIFMGAGDIMKFAYAYEDLLADSQSTIH